jgi:hypothetical protein
LTFIGLKSMRFTMAAVKYSLESTVIFGWSFAEKKKHSETALVVLGMKFVHITRALLQRPEVVAGNDSFSLSNKWLFLIGQLQ